MPKRHKVAIYMTVPDKMLFGLTARQLLILLLGGALAYRIWLIGQSFPLEEVGIWGYLLSVGMALPIVVLTLLVAFVSIASRPLEVWAFVWLRYQSIPKRYVWRSARWRRREVEQQEREEQQEEPEREEPW